MLNNNWRILWAILWWHGLADTDPIFCYILLLRCNISSSPPHRCKDSSDTHSLSLLGDIKPLEIQSKLTALRWRWVYATCTMLPTGMQSPLYLCLSELGCTTVNVHKLWSIKWGLACLIPLNCCADANLKSYDEHQDFQKGVLNHRMTMALL